MIDEAAFAPRRVLYRTFGCKLNFAETSSVGRELARRGFLRAGAGHRPDIIVVNTCSVTDLADRKCRRAIKSLAKSYPEATLIVTGCYAQLKPDEVGEIEGVDIVAGSNEKARIADLLDRWESTHERMVTAPPAKELREFTYACSADDRTRHFLKVQDGCDCFCTYCTIPYARGRSRSGTIDRLVAQARDVAEQKRGGGSEIVLTGVNIGDFGKGRADRLIDLIRELDGVEGIDRYRISSIEPDLLTDEIIDFVAHSRAFMPHFHVPLQCGSDAVLRLMRRRYDSALFRGRVEAIRNAMPDAFIGVDLIVGARGEGEEQFEESRAFVESLDVSRLHVFPYSERPGTRALDLPGAVSGEDRAARARVMLRLSDAKAEAFASRFIGRVRPVLLEHRRRGAASVMGFTDNYLRVEVAAGLIAPERDGCIEPMLLTGVKGVDDGGECIVTAVPAGKEASA